MRRTKIVFTECDDDIGAHVPLQDTTYDLLLDESEMLDEDHATNVPFFEDVSKKTFVGESILPQHVASVADDLPPYPAPRRIGRKQFGVGECHNSHGKRSREPEEAMGNVVGFTAEGDGLVQLNLSEAHPCRFSLDEDDYQDYYMKSEEGSVEEDEESEEGDGQLLECIAAIKRVCEEEDLQHDPRCIRFSETATSILARYHSGELDLDGVITNISENMRQMQGVLKKLAIPPKFPVEIDGVVMDM